MPGHRSIRCRVGCEQDVDTFVELLIFVNGLWPPSAVVQSSFACASALPLEGKPVAVVDQPRTVQKEDRSPSGTCAVIIVEHSIETLAPMHRLRWCDDRGGPQELVC